MAQSENARNQTPPTSPRYDYPSRSYPYPHVNLEKIHATPTCLPPAPPPSATSPTAALGEYFFPFPQHSSQPCSPGYMASPRTSNSFSGPSQPEMEEPPSPAYPQMPRRSSFNYVHDLAEFSRRIPPPHVPSLEEQSTSATESPEESAEKRTTPPHSPGQRKPRRPSLRDYLPLGRLPLVRPNGSESDTALSEEDSSLPEIKQNKPMVYTPPESPLQDKHPHHKQHHVPRSHHHRHHHHTDPNHHEIAAGETSHNCFNSEDMKHMQHVQMLLEEAVDAFVLAGDERRRRRESFGGEGRSFTATAVGGRW